jgi:hypothetical protein
MAIKKTIIAVLITASIFCAPVFAHAQGTQEDKERK